MLEAQEGPRISQTVPETAQKGQGSARTCQALWTLDNMKTANALKIEPPEPARLWRWVGIGDTNDWNAPEKDQGAASRMFAFG